MIWNKKPDRRRHRVIKFHQQETEYWKNSDEMNEVVHHLPRNLRSLLPELLDKSMSREEIIAHIKRLQLAQGKGVIDDVKKSNIDRGIQLAIKQGVLEEKDGRYELTPGGREIAEFMQEVIPSFMNKIFSPQIASIVTIFLHIILSILKLTFGFISRSAGLISDGIDNSVDTVSSILVWLGIKFNRERLASILVIVMMFFSLGGIVLVTYHKIINPGPVREGIITFAISALCGLLMLGLSAYQYMAGKKYSNFAIMCQAVDSRNHFYTSLLVCAGIVLSFLAETYHTKWLYYADAGASSMIGLLILKSAVELIIELNKPEGEVTHISHFMANAHEKVKKKAISGWLWEQLADASLTREQLQENFIRQFCEEVPKILLLSEMGYRPQNTNDLWGYLEQLIKEKKIIFSRGKYKKA